MAIQRQRQQELAYQRQRESEAALAKQREAEQLAGEFLTLLIKFLVKVLVEVSFLNPTFSLNTPTTHSHSKTERDRDQPEETKGSRDCHSTTT